MFGGSQRISSDSSHGFVGPAAVLLLSEGPFDRRRFSPRFYAAS